MDQPGLDERVHRQALRDLGRINWLAGAAARLWRRIRPLAAERHGRPLRLLDVACGGGDVAVAVSRKAARAGLALEVEGCDISPVAVAHAAEQARTRGAAARFFQRDVLAAPLPEEYDVVTSTLFLHHLDDRAAVGLLRSMAQAARRLVLIDDLVRCLRGYVLAFAAPRLLRWSPVVRVDALLSVSAAFTPGEARHLAEEAGLHGARITRHWPCRFLMSWRRP